MDRTRPLHVSWVGERIVITQPADELDYSEHGWSANHASAASNRLVVNIVLYMCIDCILILQ